jgi:hypothetical protein
MINAISIPAAEIVAARCYAFVAARKKPYLDRLGLDHDAVDKTLDQVTIINGGQGLCLTN